MAPSVHQYDGLLPLLGEQQQRQCPLRRLLRRPRNDTSPKDGRRSLGTFEGVFAPVALTMISSIIFLRIGYIVGNAGILHAGLQLGIAYVILVCTVLSTCAIATNGAVEGGGVYFMCSRTLGMEFGGAVGILMWFSSVVGCALFLAACTEGLVSHLGPAGFLAQVLPDGTWLRLGYSTIAGFLCLAFCLVGARLLGKIYVAVLALVLTATAVTAASFFADYEVKHAFTVSTPGCDNCTTSVEEGSFVGIAAASPDRLVDTFVSNLYPKYSVDCSDWNVPVDYFVCFAVLFSGMTGIMSGANMSADLRQPGRDIPRGTLSALLLTFVVLVVLALLTALTCTPVLLQRDCLYISTFSFWPPIVFVGLTATAFSSSLNKLIGASRLLEAMAKDVVFGPFLSFVGKFTTSKGNPVSAVIFSWLFVQAFLFMGSLNAIAQLACIFNLLSYFMVNLACLGLELASAPNFRPLFTFFSWQSCLIGLVGSTVMMFLVSPMFAAVGIFLCLSLILAIHFFSPMLKKHNVGSLSQALIFHQVRKYLLLLDPRKAHVKFWRPQVLLLVDNPRTSCALIDFVNSMKKGGLYILGHVYTGTLKSLEHDPCQEKLHDWMDLAKHLRVKAFVELTVASCLREGLQHLVRMAGIGGLRPNIVIMGFLDEMLSVDDFLSPTSAFATSRFEDVFPPLSSRASGNLNASSWVESTAHISKENYVGSVMDVNKMHRNVCLCRHFQSLQYPASKSKLGRVDKKKRFFLDVWLVDFFKSTPWGFNADVVSSRSGLFLLQLASIVGSVPRWSKATLRVFCSAEAENVSRRAAAVAKSLEELRIRAEVIVIVWPSIPAEEVSLASAGRLVISRSENTLVTFLELPELPAKEEDYVDWLDAIRDLTEGWPPTVIARGVSDVTSVEL